MIDDIKEMCLPDTPRPWTHGDHGCMHETCPNQSHTGSAIEKW